MAPVCERTNERSQLKQEVGVRMLIKYIAHCTYVGAIHIKWRHYGRCSRLVVSLRHHHGRLPLYVVVVGGDPPAPTRSLARELLYCSN